MAVHVIDRKRTPARCVDAIAMIIPPEHGHGQLDRLAKELKELREQNARLKRLLAEAELVKDALREVAKGKF